MKFRFSLPLLTFAAVALLQQESDAALLVGFHDFNNGVNSTDPSESFVSGFSGAITETAASTGSSDTGGSGSGTYGGQGSTGDNNGFARTFSTGTLGFTFTNGTGSAYTISGLLFDALINSGTLNVIGGSESQNYSGSSSSYTPLNFSFNTPVTLVNGASITFTFLAGAGARIDNVALVGEQQLSAIPEPGSLLALGALVGSGIFLRSRRRPLTSAIPA